MYRLRFLIPAVLLVLGVTPAIAQNTGACYDEIGCTTCDGQNVCDGCFGSCIDASGWAASVDAIFLRRDDPDSGVLAFNTDNAAQNLNADDFDFGTETGVDLSLTRVIGDCNALELRYFGVDDWDERAIAETTANDLLRFNAAIPVFATAGDAIAATYSSELHNAEINLSHQLRDWLAVAAGFRYLELEELLAGGLVNAAIPVDYVAATQNRLYGAQMGMQALLWFDDLMQLDVIGKAGIYGNDAEHNAFMDTGVATLNARGSDDQTAFIGEIGINGGIFVCENLTLRGGYRLLWLDGVAVASDQLAASDFFAGTGIDSSGDVFYRGAFAGLELTY